MSKLSNKNHMVKNSENIIVGISIGDLNGVGPEVVLKSFEDVRMMELCTPVVFANAKLVSYIKKTLNLNINVQGIDNLDQIVLGKLNVVNVWKEGVNLEFGKLDESVGKYAVKSLEAAAKALKEEKIDVLVTAPVNKFNIQSEQFSFPGHTDYLSKELEGDAVMLMVYEGLRVGLLTDHVPVSEVSNLLTSELLANKVAKMKETLIQDFGISKPKIAVLGLNPHSGDNGVIGKEEEKIIKPTLKKLFDEGTYVFGPFSSDGFFGSNAYRNYDAVLAMYHDQGLIPFKTLSFGKGVNFSAGLRKIRTSPDHGTAYDIAGKGLADETSFKEALYLSLDIYKKRLEYKELSKNPLKTKQN